MLTAGETGHSKQVRTGHLQQVRLTQDTQWSMTVCGVNLTHLQCDTDHLSAISSTTCSLTYLFLPPRMIFSASTFPVILCVLVTRYILHYVRKLWNYAWECLGAYCTTRWGGCCVVCDHDRQEMDTHSRWEMDTCSRWDWLTTLNKVWPCVVLVLHISNGAVVISLPSVANLLSGVSLSTSKDAGLCSNLSLW